MMKRLDSKPVETFRFQVTQKPIQSGPAPSVFCFRVHGSQPLVSVLSLCTVLGTSYSTSTFKVKDSAQWHYWTRKAFFLFRIT